MGQLSPTELRPGAQDHTGKMGSRPWGRVSPPEDSAAHSVHSWAPTHHRGEAGSLGCMGEGLDSILPSLPQSSPRFWGCISAGDCHQLVDNWAHDTTTASLLSPCTAISVAQICPSAPTTDSLVGQQGVCGGRTGPCLTASHPTQKARVNGMEPRSLPHSSLLPLSGSRRLVQGLGRQLLP